VILTIERNWEIRGGGRSEIKDNIQRILYGYNSSILRWYVDSIIHVSGRHILEQDVIENRFRQLRY